MMQLNREIHQTELDMEHALQEGDIEKARTLKETRDNLLASRDNLEKKNRRVSKNKVPVVGENEIADVVAGWTKIPVSRLTESEARRTSADTAAGGQEAGGRRPSDGSGS